ncbi:hypothetical protein MRX96_008129 [Rhipicephalus microplus]
MEDCCGLNTTAVPPLMNCWDFVYGSARPIFRPSVDQSRYSSGHQWSHVLKYQTVMGANGDCVRAGWPVPWQETRRWLVEASCMGESGLYSKLQCLTRRCLYCIYGDPTYPLRTLLVWPNGSATLTEQQQLFNKVMRTVQQAAEGGVWKGDSRENSSAK